MQRRTVDRDLDTRFGLTVLLPISEASAAQRAGDGGQRFSGSDAFEDAGPAALVGDLLFDEPLYRLGGHLVALPRPEIAGAAAAREIMPPLLVPRPALPKLREHQPFDLW